MDAHGIDGSSKPMTNKIFQVTNEFIRDIFSPIKKLNDNVEIWMVQIMDMIG